MEEQGKYFFRSQVYKHKTTRPPSHFGVRKCNARGESRKKAFIFIPIHVLSANSTMHCPMILACSHFAQICRSSTWNGSKVVFHRMERKACVRALSQSLILFRLGRKFCDRKSCKPERPRPVFLFQLVP